MSLTLFCFTMYTLPLLHAIPVTSPTDEPALNLEYPDTDTTHYSTATTTIPRQTTVPRHCEYEGIFYSPGQIFSEQSDEDGWCHNFYCRYDGNVILWNNYICKSSPTTLTSKKSSISNLKQKGSSITSAKSTLPPTNLLTLTTNVPPVRCEYEGKFYFPGESFGEGTNNEAHCYGLYCSHEGFIIPWDNYECGTTPIDGSTTKITSPLATTEQKTTRPTSKPQTNTPPTTSPQVTTQYATTIHPPITIPTTTPQTPPFNTMTQTTTTTPSISTLQTTTPGLSTCEYNGRFYGYGELFGEGIDEEGWCYSLYCDYDGNVIPQDNFNCDIMSPRVTTTNILKTTTTPTTNTTTPVSQNTSPKKTGCEYHGKFYAPGETFEEGNDGEGWCYSLYCDYDGNVIPRDNFNCQTTVATTAPRLPGCEYDGKFYAPGDSFGEGNDGMGWCYGMFCDEYGRLTAWDDFNCDKTTPTSTTPPSTAPPRDILRTTLLTTTVHTTTLPTTRQQTTTLPITTPSTTTLKTTTIPTTTSQTTTPPTANPRNTASASTITRHTTQPPTNIPLTTTPTTGLPVTLPAGCEYNGKFYAPGESFGEGYDGEGWCYGNYCSENGNVIPWDNFNCDITTAIPMADITTTNHASASTFFKTTSSYSPITPSTSATTLPKRAGCEYEGKLYAIGEKISEESDGFGWCYGLLCQNDGTVIAWDDFKCETTTKTKPTTSVTTTPQPTSNPTTGTPIIVRSKLIPSTPESTGWCFFKGKYYENGDVISQIFHGWSWCSGWYCNDGKVDSWSNFNCVTPTTLPKPIPSGTNLQCFYDGVYHNEGDLIDTSEGSGYCGGLVCRGGLFVPYENEDCGSATKTNPSITKTDDLLTTKTTTMPAITNTRLYVTNTDQPQKTQHTPLTKSRLHKNLNNRQPNTNPPLHFTKITRELVESTNLPIKNTNSMFETKHATQSEDTTNELISTNIQSTTQKFLTKLTTRMKDSIKLREWTSKPTTTQESITNPTTMNTRSKSTIKSELTTKEPATQEYLPYLSTETDEATQPLEHKLCFHEGRLYEEGDIISRNFNAKNWCSGWYCKGGKLIAVDCSNITRNQETSSSKAVFTPVTSGPEPTVCFHDGRYYEEGDLAANGDDWCSGWICQNGKMVLWENCKIELESTKSPRVTRFTSGTTIAPNITLTAPEISTKPLDISIKFTENAHLLTKGHKARTTVFSKQPQTLKITSKTTPETRKKTLYSTRSLPDTSTVITYTSTEPTPSASSPPQTTPPKTFLQQCFYEGKHYPPGDVTQGFLKDGRCYGVICDISGVIIQWVSTTCTPTEPPTADIRNSLPGCVYHDKYYPPGRISRISDETSWCLDVICTEEGKIVTMNNMNCDKPATTEPTVATTTRPAKCLYNGMVYPAGVIKEGFDQNGWCYKVICQDNGQLYLWGGWDCERKSTTPTTQETTPTALNTCTYNGRSYPVGKITRGRDASGWCYGMMCRNDGQIVLWGSFKCNK